MYVLDNVIVSSMCVKYYLGAEPQEESQRKDSASEEKETQQHLQSSFSPSFDHVTKN